MEGVRQRGLRLVELGHQVEVASLDDPQQPYARQFPLPLHALGPPRGGYRYSRRLLPWLKSHVRDYDAVIINGLWQYHSFAAWRALRRSDVPYFVFTHGMLDPWFKTTYPLKHLKKSLYWPWAEYRVLRDARAVLFTSEEERLLARRSFRLYSAREEVVAYGAKEPPANLTELRQVFYAAHPHLIGKRLVLFLSRVHEKKGCDLLVHAFAAVAGADPRLHLVVAGPDQTGLVPRLKSLAGELCIAERITWPGMLRDDMKWGAFSSADAFILPSHQENFGIAVAEALGCGLPVLISDKVNIWREVAAHGAGFVAPDTLMGTTDLFRRWLGLCDADKRSMGECAKALFGERFTVEAMASGLLEVVNRHAGAAARADAAVKVARESHGR